VKTAAALALLVTTLAGCPEAARAPAASVIEVDPKTTTKPIAIGASLESPMPRDHEVVDRRSGDTYRWIELGSHRWLAENARVPLEGSWCYDDDPASCARYGRLYTWDTAKEACPAGWRVPTEEEWEEPLHATRDMNKLLDGKGSGFDIVFAGWRDSRTGQYKELGTNFYFWSATEFDDDKSRARLRWNLSPTDLQIATDVKTHGFSVRCVAD
jgi:uncharacterized protein (TIGR02145 family)